MDENGLQNVIIDFLNNKLILLTKINIKNMIEIERNLNEIIKGLQTGEKITKYCKNYLNIISDTNFDYVEVIILLLNILQNN